MCWKLVCWSKHVCNAVILPSHWSYTETRNRDAIHPITRHCTTNMTPTILATIYWPPMLINAILQVLSAFLTTLCSVSPNLILLGDFNIHWDSIINVFTKDFTSCLDSFGQQQHIDFQTHSKGHILDLICCSGVTPLHCCASDLPISDHKLISFDVILRLSSD